MWENDIGDVCKIFFETSLVLTVIALVFFIWAILVICVGAIVMLLWNFVFGTIFPIHFWQGVALALLTGVLFGEL